MADRPLREARVDLAAIAHNVTTLRKAVATEHTLIVVKADGYGHGAVPVARTAIDAGADWLGVADVREALELRAAGISAPILAWLHHPGADFAEAILAGVDIGVSYAQQLERVASARSSTGGTAEVQLKVDTGLGRNGSPVQEWETLFARAAEQERRGRLHVRGLFSHLANAGHDEDAAQIELFRQAIDTAVDAGLTPELIHLASTAGALSEPTARFTMVRVGIGVYGLSPFSGDPIGEAVSAVVRELRPAMELSADIVAVETERGRTIAVVPLGYADGLLRAGSAGARVSINGTNYPLAEPIGFDRFTVELGADVAWVGDRTVLFGDPVTGVPSADDWAASAGTINYEVVTRLASHIERSCLP